MAGTCLSRDGQFLDKLRALFEASKSKGSIFISHKSCASNWAFLRWIRPNVARADTYEEPGAEAAASTSKPCPCLVRVQDGHKLKFSTLARPYEVSILEPYGVRR
jgi:hypothetical protein